METHAIEEMFAIEDRHWWFQGKRRVLLGLLDRVSASLPDGPIVDLGCGTGRTLQELRTRGRAYGIDADRDCLGFTQRRGARELVQADAVTLPLRSEGAAAITALDILEHLADDLGCAREIHRALAPGGILLASVPAYSFLWSPHDEVLHHLRRYHRRQFRELLSHAGFEIERLLAFNFLLFPPIALVRILRRCLPLKRGSTDFFGLPAPLNTALRGLFEIEWAIDRLVSIPFGVTWVAIARKRERDV